MLSGPEHPAFHNAKHHSIVGTVVTEPRPGQRSTCHDSVSGRPFQLAHPSAGTSPGDESDQRAPWPPICDSPNGTAVDDGRAVVGFSSVARISTARSLYDLGASSRCSTRTAPARRPPSGSAGLRSRTYRTTPPVPLPRLGNVEKDALGTSVYGLSRPRSRHPTADDSRVCKSVTLNGRESAIALIAADEDVCRRSKNLGLPSVTLLALDCVLCKVRLALR